MYSLDLRISHSLVSLIKSIVIDLVFLYLELWSMSQDIRLFKMPTLRFSLIPYVFYGRYFELLFHVKCFNFALFLIHVWNE